MNNPDFQTGLVVSGVGLAITFLALLIFVGVIMALKALFPYKEEVSEESETEEVYDTASETNEEEAAAAIAAVLYFRQRRSSQLGSALSEGKSSFWTSD